MTVVAVAVGMVVLVVVAVVVVVATILSNKPNGITFLMHDVCAKVVRTVLGTCVSVGTTLSVALIVNGARSQSVHESVIFHVGTCSTNAKTN